jgi:hypothetical protein
MEDIIEIKHLLSAGSDLIKWKFILLKIPFAKQDNKIQILLNQMNR